MLLEAEELGEDGITPTEEKHRCIDIFGRGCSTSLEGSSRVMATKKQGAWYTFYYPIPIIPTVSQRKGL